MRGYRFRTIVFTMVPTEITIVPELCHSRLNKSALSWSFDTGISRLGGPCAHNARCGRSGPRLEEVGSRSGGQGQGSRGGHFAFVPVPLTQQQKKKVCTKTVRILKPTWTVGVHNLYRLHRMKRSCRTFDSQKLMKTQRRVEKLDDSELIVMKRDTAHFIRACQVARTNLAADFPTSEQLDANQGRLDEERLMIEEAKEHISHAQKLLLLMQTKKEHIPMEWSTQVDDNGGCVVCVQRNWLRHGLYEQAIADIDACVARLARALRNTDVDLSKQKALCGVEHDRDALAEREIFTFNQDQELEEPAAGPAEPAHHPGNQHPASTARDS